MIIEITYKKIFKILLRVAHYHKSKKKKGENGMEALKLDLINKASQNAKD